MTDTPTTDLTPEAVERWHEEIHGMKDGPALFEGQQEYVRYEDYASLSAERDKYQKAYSLWKAQGGKAEARAEALDAKLKEAGEHIEAVSDAFAKQIGVRRHNAWPIIRAARAFLASIGDKP